MKVTWQADDIKSGLSINTRHGGVPSKLMYQQVPNEGVRYCIVGGDQVSAAMSKPDMAAYLTKNGYVPAVLLTL